MDWVYGKDHVIGSRALRESTLGSMTAAARKQWHATEGKLWFDWDAAPSAAERRKVRALRLRVDYGERKVSFPRAVARFESLEYLSMPLALASQIEPGDVPSSVRALSFDESPSLATTASLRSELVFPSVEEVDSVVGRLRFSVQSFPRLRALSLKLGPRASELAVLSHYRKLSALHLVGVSSVALLEPAEALGVQSLGIVSGRLESLEGFERFRKVKRLLLKNLRNLRDIGSLPKMPALESLEIQYCGALVDLEPVLRARRLRRLTVVASNAIDLRSVADALKRRRFSELAITGKRHLYRDEDGNFVERF